MLYVQADEMRYSPSILHLSIPKSSLLLISIKRNGRKPTKSYETFVIWSRHTSSPVRIHWPTSQISAPHYPLGQYATRSSQTTRGLLSAFIAFSTSRNF